MKHLHPRVLLPPLLIALLLLTGCQDIGELPTNPARPSAPSNLLSTSEPTPSAAAPTFTPSPEPTTSPEPTPSPEPVPSPEPTAEPAPEPTPIPGPEPNDPIFYVLMFHNVVENGVECNDWTITTSRLREDLQWLADHGYTTVLPRELVQGAPLPERAVLITFDDGYVSNYRLAFPILKEFNAKAVISIVTIATDNNVSAFLTWDMCREMVDSGLVEIGSHTHNLHGSELGIKRANGETQEQYQERVFTDLQTSIDLIEANLGTKALFLAYPHGATDSWAKGFIQSHFAVTVITRNGRVDFSKGLYDLPRYNMNEVNFVGKYLPD